MFHFEISGKHSKDEHPLKITAILAIFSVFHFDKSGKEHKEEQSQNKPLISITFSIFHFEISVNFFNNLQL